MHKSVLITRERQAALQTASKVLAKGHDVVIVPLLEIEIRDVEMLDKHTSNYVLITSFNAAKRVQDVYKDLHHLNVITVGEKSAQYLNAIGVNIIHVAADGEALLRYIGEFIQPYASIDFVCGDHIAGCLDEKLIRAGFKLNKIEVYKSVAVDSFDVAVLNRVDAVLLYSPRAAQIFADFVNKDAVANLSNIECICISQNVVDKVVGLGFKNVRVSKYPTDDSVIECL